MSGTGPSSKLNALTKARDGDGNLAGGDPRTTQTYPNILRYIYIYMCACVYVRMYVTMFVYII